MRSEPDITDLRERECYHCQGEGRVIRLGTVYEPGCGHPHWGDVDEGPCRVCDETGRIWDEAPLVDFEEMDEAFGPTPL